MLTKQEIAQVYQQNHIPNMGSVSQGDAMFLCQTLELSHPKNSCEAN